MTRGLRGEVVGTAFLLAAALVACGGGRDPLLAADTPLGTPEPVAPIATGDTALDAFTWINYRRAQAGLSIMVRNPQLDLAAQGHAAYLRLNNTVTHDQTAGLPGYTGATLLGRLGQAGYATPFPYAIGEVLSATSNPSGFYQAEECLTAIYQRFVLMEPIFKEVGTGSATMSTSYTYLTVDLTAVGGYGPGLGTGKCVSYPVDQQTNVPVNYLSDRDSPDPVRGQNEVGYPISVHADTIRAGIGITVASFTVAPRGGAALTAQMLSHANDACTPETSAALIPLAPLKAATIYDVHFAGAIAGVPVTKTWSFTTR